MNTRTPAVGVRFPYSFLGGGSIELEACAPQGDMPGGARMVADRQLALELGEFCRREHLAKVDLCDYTKIVPNERIEYTANFADDKGNKRPPIAPGVPEDGHHVVTFKDLGNDTTEMNMVEHNYTIKEARDRSQQGLEQCLDKMAAIFEK